MKITRLLAAALLLLSMTMGVFAAEPTEPPPVTWDASQSSITVTAYYSYYTDVTYTAPSTGKYALTWSASPVKHFAAMEPGPQSYTIDGVEYEVFDLTAGQQLLLRVFSDEITDPGVTYSQTLTMQPWDGSLLLPNYPYITEGEKISVDLSPGQTKNYLFRAASDGLYTQGMSYSSHWVNIYQVEGYAFPEMVNPWKTDTQQGTVYRLSAGNIYGVEISSSGGPQLADEIWIRSGDAPKNEYPAWSESERSKSVSLSSGETKSFYFTPSQTGEYAIYRSMSALSLQILDASIVRDFNAGGQYQGDIYYLNAGQQYVVELTGRDSVSDTVYLEKTRSITSAEIYLALSDVGKGSYILAVRTDPVYAYAEGVRWTVSDSDLFNIISESAVSLDLKATGQGSATVTAVVGGITCTYQLSTGAVSGAGDSSGSGSVGSGGTTTPGTGSSQQTPTESTGSSGDVQPTDSAAETTAPEVTADTGEPTTAPEQTVLENIMLRQELSALAEGQSYVVTFDEYQLTWDTAAVKALLEQTQAQQLAVQAQKKALSELNEAQQSAVAGRETGFVLELGISENETHIHQFGDGTVTVRVPYTPERERDWGVYYLSPDGAAEQMEAWEEDGQICFQTDHFSVFALLYDQKAENSLTWLIWVGVGVVVAAAAAAGTVWYVKKKKE